MDKTSSINQDISKKGIVMFDGYCVLCNNTVKFLIRIDRQRKLMFTTINSELGRELSGKLSDGSESIVLLWQDKLFVKSDAVLTIIQIIGMPWSILSVFRIIPKFIRDSVYGFIAKTRYRIFGKKDKCMIPDESVKDRFIL